MRSVRKQRTVCAHSLQSVESTGDGIRPVAHSRRDCLYRGRSVGTKSDGTVRAVAKRSATYTGPQIVGHCRTRFPGRRFTATGVQVVFDYETIE